MLCGPSSTGVSVAPALGVLWFCLTGEGSSLGPWGLEASLSGRAGKLLFADKHIVAKKLSYWAVS